MKKIGYLFIVSLLAIGSCSESEIVNPYDGVGIPPEPPVDSLDLDPWDLVALHRDIFAPTCANSGCHDGTFEPDYRTIESTYNTLVWHPIIKNDPAGSYTYRVVPGNISESVLWNRITEDIDGQSGIMPLTAAYDPESEWFQNKETHLANIKKWIEDGAPDMFGNLPSNGNNQPGFLGVYAEADGTPCVVNARIHVPPGSQQVTVWVSITDMETPVTQFSYNKVKMSTNTLFQFDTVATEMDLVVLGSPITKIGFFGSPVEYNHKFSFSTTTWASEEKHYFRLFTKDPLQEEVTEIPQDGSAIHIKKYFSWKFD